MKVSIVVITYNEAKNIAECLDSLLALRMDDVYEIIVVDGGSIDSTREIVKSYAAKKDVIRLVVDPIGHQTTSRNLGIEEAKYEFVAFTDADCVVPRDWLDILTTKFQQCKSPFLAGVGGANIPPVRSNLFQRALGIAADSFLGSLGSIQAKPLGKDRRVMSLSCSNALYEKRKLVAVGMFTTGENKSGDDWELGLKLRKRGCILMGISNSFVWHKMRQDSKSFWNNMILYGKVRMKYIVRFPKEHGLVYFLPLFFILAMLLSLLGFRYRIFLLPLLYFPFMLLYSFVLAFRKNQAALFPVVFWCFMLEHFGYAIGEVMGLSVLFEKKEESIEEKGEVKPKKK